LCILITAIALFNIDRIQKMTIANIPTKHQ